MGQGTERTVMLDEGCLPGAGIRKFENYRSIERKGVSVRSVAAGW